MPPTGSSLLFHEHLPDDSSFRLSDKTAPRRKGTWPESPVMKNCWSHTSKPSFRKYLSLVSQVYTYLQTHQVIYIKYL